MGFSAWFWRKPARRGPVIASIPSRRAACQANQANYLPALPGGRALGASHAMANGRRAGRWLVGALLPTSGRRLRAAPAALAASTGVSCQSGCAIARTMRHMADALFALPGDAKASPTNPNAQATPSLGFGPSWPGSPLARLNARDSAPDTHRQRVARPMLMIMGGSHWPVATPKASARRPIKPGRLRAISNTMPPAALGLRWETFPCPSAFEALGRT